MVCPKKLIQQLTMGHVMPSEAIKLAASKFYGGGRKAPEYLEQEVLSWSKEKIVLKTYDFFIVSAKRGEIVKMNKALLELMSALNFEYSEISTRLFRLYEYCQKCILNKKIDEAVRIIQDLRDTWAKAFNLS